MRTVRFAFLLLVGLFLCNGLFVSAAMANPQLKKALKHLDDFEIRQAVGILEKLQQSNLPRATKVKVLVHLGIGYLYLRKQNKGEAAFARALRLDSSASLPSNAPSRIRKTFQKVRQNVVGSSPAPVRRTSPPPPPSSSGDLRLPPPTPRSSTPQPPVARPPAARPPTRDPLDFGDLRMPPPRRTSQPPARRTIQPPGQGGSLVLPPPVRRQQAPPSGLSGGSGGNDSVAPNSTDLDTPRSRTNQPMALRKVKPSSFFKRKFTVKYQRPMIVYLGMDGQGIAGLASDKREKIERGIREQIETRRFIVLPIPVGKNKRSEVVDSLVKTVTLRSKGVARMRAAWNSYFQGYAVTSEMLRGIQNASYLYFVELLEVKGTQFSTAKNILNLILALVGTSVDTPPTYAYKLKARLHLQRLAIFRCTGGIQQKSIQHANACRSKIKDSYAGFAVPYKQIDVNVMGLPQLNWTSAFNSGVEILSRTLMKKMSKMKDFNLHAPITRSQLENVWVKMGKNEGVKLNQLFVVKERRIGGKLVRKGLIKITEVGDNRMKMVNQRKVRVNPKAPLFSRGQIVSTSGTFYLKRGMLAYEHPMTGVTFGFFPGAHLPMVEQISGLPVGLSGRFTFDLDLSEKANLNDFFLHMGLEAGLFKYVPALAHIGVIKKFFLRQFSLSLGARVNFGYLVGFGFAAGADVFAGLDILFTPSFSLSFRAGFRGGVGISDTFDLTQIGPFVSVGPLLSF